MRKNWIALLLVLFSGGVMFNACHFDEVEVPPEGKDYNNLENMLNGITNSEVRKAIVWYDTHWPGSPTSKGAATEHPLFKNMVPKWPYAYVRSKGNQMSVEVSLQTESRALFTLPENAAAYDQTKNSMYITSLTRLIILKNKTTDITQGFFMTLVPSKKYMEAKNFNVYRSTYFQRAKDFDGYILFHELDGSFANGWRYADGIITHSVHKAKSESPHTRGGYWTTVTRCYPVYNRVCTGHYETTESGDRVYVEDNCYDQYMRDECYQEQVWVPTPDPEPDPDPFPGGGGGYEPDREPCPYGTPRCPGGKLCKCCPICKGPCIVIACPGCGKKHCTEVHIDCNDGTDSGCGVTNSGFDDINAADTVGENNISFTEFLKRVSDQKEREHSITFKKVWSTDSIRFLNILTDYELGEATHVGMSCDQSTHAIIHTHPDSTGSAKNTLPPSARDVLNVLQIVTEKEQKSDGRIDYTYLNFKTSYVIANGYTFALTVRDRKKAAQFLNNNPNFVGADEGFIRGTNVGNAYFSAKSKITKHKGVELEAYAIAYALQKSDAGIQLLYKKDGQKGFTALKARDLSSQLIYTYICK